MIKDILQDKDVRIHLNNGETIVGTIVGVERDWIDVDDEKYVPMLSVAYIEQYDGE